MTGPIILSAQAELHQLGASLAASLPLSFAFQAREQGAQAMLVDGRLGWASAALSLAKREMIAIVVDPGDDDPDIIDNLAGLGTPVHFAEGFAGNPAIPALRERLREAYTIFVHEAVTPEGIAASALQCVRIARALGVGRIAVAGVQVRGGAALLSARAAVGSGEPVHFRAMLSTSRAVPAHHLLRAYGAAALASLRLYTADIARPAEATVTDADGCMTLPTMFENAHRAALRSVAAGATGDALRDFAEDVRLVRSMGLDR